jgi:23S rRNA (pseudouridine1915-N3)-methyltransferase
MRITILTVGKQQEPAFKTALELYTQRIAHFTQTSWLYLTPSGNNDRSTSLEHESAKIIGAIPKGAYVVLLDERGIIKSSPEVADLIEARQVNGQDLVFIIGGAYGVNQKVFATANETWSLSKLVFPHQIVRIVLAEQLYRGFSILKNLPYHHK